MPGYNAGRAPGIALSRRSAGRGGDHRGHAPDARRSIWLQAARADRRALARRAAHPRSARARRARARPRARVAAGAQRQGRPAPRDRQGRLGLRRAATAARRPGSAAGRAAFCVIDGPTRGRPWSSANVRAEFRRLAAQARRGRRRSRVAARGVRRRFAPYQLRLAHAIELAREGVPLNVIQLQLGHANLGTSRLGRGGARCRRYRRSVPPTRPPNRTCPFLSIRLSTGHAVADRDADVMQRRFPAEWWLGLFRRPPTARGCCGRDSDIGSLTPRRAMRASCLHGWSSCAPNTFA